MKAYELLARPENWTQKVAARNDEGFEVPYFDPNAVSWCILGAIWKVYGFCCPESQLIVTRLCEVKCTQGVHIWNDAPERTYQEVIDLLKTLDI